MPPPRVSQAALGVAWVLLLHALLLALLLWVWPRIERFRSTNESPRIQVRLAALEQDKAQTPAAMATEAAMAKRKPKNASPISPITRTPASTSRTSLSFEPATQARPVIPAEVEPAPAPVQAASSVLSSAATKDAIKRAISNKTLAEQTRSQLESLRAKTTSETLAQEMKDASIPDCIGPNENATLLFAPKLVYDAITGRCK